MGLDLKLTFDYSATDRLPPGSFVKFATAGGEKRRKCTPGCCAQSDTETIDLLAHLLLPNRINNKTFGDASDSESPFQSQIHMRQLPQVRSALTAWFWASQTEWERIL